MRIGTENFRHLGVYKRDLLIIDKSKKPTPDSLVVFFRDGEFGITLLKTLPNAALKIVVWGVVTYVIHKT